MARNHEITEPGLLLNSWGERADQPLFREITMSFSRKYYIMILPGHLFSGPQCLPMQAYIYAEPPFGAAQTFIMMDAFSNVLSFYVGVV